MLCQPNHDTRWKQSRGFLSMCLILFATPGLVRAQWPQWMGPNLDGISPSQGWSDNWTDDSVKPIWSTEIGTGFSSVAVSEGKLLTMGFHDGTETVFCFEADTGKPIWRHDYPSELIANLYEGGPGSTPTIDQGRVYALGKTGQLFCLDLSTGDVLWQKTLTDDLEVPIPEWGFNSSAFIHRGNVLFEAGRVVAYDAKSGVKQWQTSKHVAGYGCVRALGDRGQFLTALDCDALRVYDARDGSEVDAFPWKSPFQTNSTTPIVKSNTIYISTGYQVGCGLFQFDDMRLKLVYDNRDMRNHFNNSILYRGHLYGFDGNSNLGRVVHLNCMNHETGELIWKHRGLGCGSLMIAGGKLIILSDDGRLVCAPATPDGFHATGETQILEGRCWSVPVVVGTRVYARNARGTLVCVQLPRHPPSKVRD